MISSIRSSIPGRVRLDVPAIRSQPALAAAAQAAVGTIAHVTSVKASAASGTILVVFEPEADWESLHSEIDARLAELREFSGSPGRAGDSSLARVLRLSLPPWRQQVEPLLLTLGAHSLNMLQNLVLVSSASVANGDTPSLLRWLGVTDVSSQLKVITVTSLALTAGEALAQDRRDRSWQGMARNAEHRLRSDVFTHLEEQDLVFFHAHGTGSLLNVLTKHVESIGELIESTDDFLESLVTVLVGGAVLVRTSPTLALIVGSALPLVGLSTRLFGSKTKTAFFGAIQPASRLTQAVENILTGIVEVKSFTAEKQEAQRVAGLSRDVADSALVASAAATLQSTVIQNALYLAGAMAIGYGASLVVFGRAARPQFTRMMYWIPTMMRAFGGTVQLSRTYYSAAANATQLVQVLESVSAIHAGPRSLDPAAVRGDIRFEDVSFAYEPPRRVLRSVSIRVPAGRSLGIVGPNGSGKSTLLKLLLRFYEPDTGRILLDGQDIRDLVIADLRASISLVSQDVYLFDDTLVHNVRYGRPAASDEEVLAAMEAAGIGDLLDELPQGLATPLGERGHRLSGGQRQRVALARALLKGAPILALDEATSHLDYEAEAALKATLRTTAAGKTVILIAHRLSSVRDLDNIIVVDNGTIIEQGSHRALLEQRGLYFRLWQLQTG